MLHLGRFTINRCAAGTEGRHGCRYVGVLSLGEIGVHSTNYLSLKKLRRMGIGPDVD